jgi:hypothetical protein
MRRVVAAILDSLLIFWVLLVGPLCWILRDGLGPGAVDSHGVYAVLRFLFTFYWGPVLGALVVLRLALRERGGVAGSALGGERLAK